jgi:spore coat polysaccharide biosynthesis predicted glycosyltransferase SpsG
VFAICIEASHSKGMGHLFRMLNFSKFLKTKNKDFIFIINNNEELINILKSHDIAFEIVNLDDDKRNWEQDIAARHNIIYWVNDRLQTTRQHALNVNQSNIKLITFDDFGTGANLSDLSIYGLANKGNYQGKKILQGVEYLILNEEIDLYKKIRTGVKKILVSLGGSDTYGVTIKILKLLKKHHIQATIHIGPSFLHNNALKQELTSDYKVKAYTPSLIKEFSNYDLAFTGGGSTPFEANASGLPCLIIANELFEIENGYFLESVNSSRFLGYYQDIDEAIFSKLNSLDINLMSQNGMQILNTNAVEKIYENIIN